LFKKVKVTAFIIVLALAVLRLPNVRGLESLGQDALPVGAPLFTSDDINIPGLALDLNTSIAQYNPPVYISPYDWELLQAVYTRNDIYHSESYAYIVLNIYYFDIVEYAKDKFNETWQANKGNSELYQTDQETYPTIIDSEFSTNYGSLITSENVGSADNPDYLRLGSRAIYGADPSYSGDPHIAILISAAGKAFISDGEIRALMDTVTQHARDLVLNTPRKTPAPSITPTTSTSPTPSNAAPSLSPSPSPTQTQGTGEEFEVMWFEGTVQVLRADSSDWIPATTGMVLREGDQIRTMGGPSKNRVLLHYAGSAQSYYEGTDIRVEGDSSLTVENYSETHPPGNLLGGIGAILLIALDTGFYSIVTHMATSELMPCLIQTYDAWICEEGTEFEIIVNSQGTSVYTFEGAVRVYDFNGSSNVLVGENKTCTVQKARGVSIPTYFNPDAVDQWWTSFPESSTLGVSDSGIFNYLIIAVIVIVIVAAAIGAFAVSKRKKMRLPPPPPPPPPPQAPAMMHVNCMFLCFFFFRSEF
jgi:hypothetical protein